jgi:hypothetical protein
MINTSDISESEIKKSQTIRPDTVVSATSNSSDKTKKTIKTEKTDKSDSSDEKTEKSKTDGRTSKSGASDGETDNRSSISPRTKPSRSKSTKIDFEPRKDATIKFEDDMYKGEKHYKKLDANQFIGYLTEFFDENEDIIMPPPDYIDNDDSKIIVAYII